ncbi:MAG TPA: hypothetical protein VGS41_05570, partial [Chthonomonadales bacterium]|nr:hypothetical protein [Chthonomonadales bacterium]
MRLALLILALPLWIFRSSPALSQGSGKYALPPLSRPAPAFSLKDISGAMRSPSQFRGRTVVLGFFCGCDRCHAFGETWG